MTRSITRILRDGTFINYSSYLEEQSECVMIYRTPGRLRKLLRRIGLDKSTWTFKLVRMECA